MVVRFSWPKIRWIDKSGTMQLFMSDAPVCLVKPGKKYHYLRYDAKGVRLARRRTHQQTEEFCDRYRWRAGVEGTMSQYDRLTGVKRLGVRGLKAVGFCATLKAMGVSLFRTTAVRRARNRATDTGPGSKSPFSRFVSRGKGQITAMNNAINQFFIPAAYSGPFELKMAA